MKGEKVISTASETVGEQSARRAGEGLIVKGIWLYVLLVIFEGALRKWVLPGLSGPLLIVRDPLAIALLCYAWYLNLFPNVIYVNIMLIISGISFFTTLFIGHGNLAVALYGLRILVIHFPFIFLMGSILRKDDVLKIGKMLVWIAIPMAVLVALQFYSPQSAWVNRGVGGDMSGSGFSGAMGYFRPSATFSFTNGTSQFFSLVACFIFYFWLKSEQFNKLVLIAATCGLIVVIPLSISRGLLFTLGVMSLFVLAVASRKPKFLVQITFGSIGMVVLLLLMSNFDFFQTATEVYSKRFETAAQSEGGLEGTLIDRYLGGMVHAIGQSADVSFFGLGLGMGTNAGSALLGAGRSFLISEGEWGRLIGEMGALLGLGVIFMRLQLSFKLALESYNRISKGEILPWLLFSFAVLIFPQGQWAQPMTLGFSTVIMGLLIASFNAAPVPSPSS